MPCQPFNEKPKDYELPVTGFVCRRGVRPLKAPLCWVSHCVAPGDKLCDWPVPGGKTCDRPICARHAKNVGPDKDYCPAHWVESLKEPTP